MKLKIFCLRDQKVGTFLPLITMAAKGQLLRELTDAVNGTEGLPATHPEDLELFELGEFDNESGEISAFKPKSVIVLTELKHKPIK